MNGSPTSVGAVLVLLVIALLASVRLQFPTIALRGALFVSQSTLFPVDSAVNVRRYVLVIESILLEGRDRETITINGTSPGPLLTIELGETLHVTVINNIHQDPITNKCVGTVIHWHGMTQQGSVYNDGVAGLTQCAIQGKGCQSINPNSPCNSMTYSFTPQRLGTFWYHGHYDDQYPNGE
jgi:FtsP/CotA-like multicopper oxidase with cupredoxin domain